MHAVNLCHNEKNERYVQNSLENISARQCMFMANFQTVQLYVDVLHGNCTLNKKLETNRLCFISMTSSTFKKYKL